MKLEWGRWGEDYRKRGGDERKDVSLRSGGGGILLEVSGMSEEKREDMEEQELIISDARDKSGRRRR